MDTMYLILGRSGSGKDHIAKGLIKQSKGALSQVLSYTNRPKRNVFENSHTFISDAEVNEIPEDQKLLKTVIAGYEYFVTPDMLKNKQIYIIEPNGLAELLSQNLPDTKYVIISVQADKDARKTAAETRGDRTLMSQMFDERSEAEKARFDSFEHQIASRDGQVQFKARYPNVAEVFVFYNDFNPSKAEKFVKSVLGDKYNEKGSPRTEIER